MDYYNENALRAEIARNHMTIRKTAEQINVSNRQFTEKLKTGNWRLSEAYNLSRVLNMDSQRFAEVFFYPKSHILSD